MLLLADDLGLGKTVAGMCPMVIPENLPAVVVYPAALPNHWPEKLAEFAPNLRVHHIRKGQPYPLTKQPRQRVTDLWDTLPDVILVSYHKLRGWAEMLGEIVQYAVFEECQQLRNPDSEIYRACVYLAGQARLRMGLTATPIYNYGSEFYISDEGSDPIVSDVLGVKREQIEGVRNPGEHLIERRDIGENQLRQLAQRFLKEHGVETLSSKAPTPLRRQSQLNLS